MIRRLKLESRGYKKESRDFSIGDEVIVTNKIYFDNDGYFVEEDDDYFDNEDDLEMADSLDVGSKFKITGIEPGSGRSKVVVLDDDYEIPLVFADNYLKIITG